MVTLRKLIKKSYAPIVVGSVFLILFNYCGVRSFEAAPHGEPGHHDTEQMAHEGDHGHSIDTKKTGHHEGRVSSGPSESGKKGGFCCPSNFCCSTINIDAELRDQLYYFFLNASAHTTLTPVTVVLSDPFKVQKVEWLHETGPPQIILQEPFHIKAYPTHAPPLG